MKAFKYFVLIITTIAIPLSLGFGIYLAFYKDYADSFICIMSFFTLSLSEFSLIRHIKNQ